MNKKEIGELKRRLQLNKCNIGQICGCYVNGNREVVAYLEESLGLMPQEEAEQYLAFLKKVLSGTPGRNLIDIVFSNEQVMDSEEHRLLMALREEKPEARQALYQKIIDSLDMNGENYLILCASDAYDVPFRGASDVDRAVKDYEAGQDDQVFRYFLCAVCPVKDGKPELGYFSGENEFHNCLAKQIVGAPELGFLFPAFDNRAANIYNALYYSRKPEELHHELIDGLFRVEPPTSAAEQREAFEGLLSDTTDCSMDVVRAVHEQLRAKIEAYAEEKDAEPLTVSVRELGAILTDCGAEEGQIAAFQEGYRDAFGGSVLNPENLIDTRRFEIKTGIATITVDPAQSYMVETREVNGRKFIMIPVDGETELNGLAVKV